MIKFGMLLLIILVSVVSPAFSEQEVHTRFQGLDITIPVGSGWNIVPRNVKGSSGQIAFAGEITASGALQIYWQVSWMCDHECTPERTLQMRFFPDDKSLLHFPSWGENHLVIQPKMIDIKNNKQSENFSYFPENKVRFILKDVINIPENFFKYREGFVIIPAVFRLSNLIASKECDAYHFSAAFIDINEISNVLPEQEDALSKLPVSCNSAPYDETFFVEAKIAESSSERIEVRSLPNIASDISAHLENGTIVLKVRTVDDNWVYIKAIPGDTPYSTDAKKPVVFGYLYKPIVIFLPVN